MKKSLISLLFFYFSVVSCSFTPFTPLSPEENESLQRDCGHDSPYHPKLRMIEGGTVVPKEQSVSMIRLLRDNLLFSGFLISSRHVITANNHDRIANRANCEGEHYRPSANETAALRVEINPQSNRFSKDLPLKVKSGLGLYACSKDLIRKPAIWIYELDSNITDSSQMHRPICLSGTPYLMDYIPIELFELYTNGWAKKEDGQRPEFAPRKTRVEFEKCPEKYGEELRCARGQDPICYGDAGAGLVAHWFHDERKILAGLLQEKGDHKLGQLKCNGTDPKDILLAFVPIGLLRNIFCEEIGVCTPLLPTTVPPTTVPPTTLPDINGEVITVTKSAPLPIGERHEGSVTVHAPEPMEIGEKKTNCSGSNGSENVGIKAEKTEDGYQIHINNIIINVNGV